DLSSSSQIEIISPLHIDGTRTATSSEDCANRRALAASGDRANNRTHRSSHGGALLSLCGLAVVTHRALGVHAHNFPTVSAHAFNNARKAVPATVPQTDCVKVQSHHRSSGQPATAFQAR